MNIQFYKDEYLNLAVSIFTELSQFYLKEMSSSREEVRRNLINNVLAEESGVEVVLAIANGVAIGMATISLLYPAPKETGQLYLKELFVVPGFQRKGVAKKIMSFLARVALDRGCSRLDWTTERDNILATAFYRSINAPELGDKIYYRAEGEYLTQLAADA